MHKNLSNTKKFLLPLCPQPRCFYLWEQRVNLPVSNRVTTKKHHEINSGTLSCRNRSILWMKYIRTYIRITQWISFVHESCRNITHWGDFMCRAIVVKHQFTIIFNEVYITQVKNTGDYWKQCLQIEKNVSLQNEDVHLFSFFSSK